MKLKIYFNGPYWYVTRSDIEPGLSQYAWEAHERQTRKATGFMRVPRGIQFHLWLHPQVWFAFYGGER